ncbi:MAG: PfkB family carbohydrate kinase [Candidatus Hydrogenedentota bacterium]
MQIERVQRLIYKFPSQRIAVVGDLMLDRYIWGSASRISQEAPVPVVAVNRQTAAPGGAANVLRNLSSLGAQPLAFGVIGQDAAGDELVSLLKEQRVDTSGILRSATRLTSEKTRIIAEHQQVVRVDNERIEAIADADRATLIASLRSAVNDGRIGSIIIEDYAKGMVSTELLSEVTALGKEQDIPVALDPHPGNHATATGLTVMTPNRAEAFAMAGVYPRPSVLPVEDDTALLDVVGQLQDTWDPKYLMITLGAHGMALFQNDHPVHHIPTQAREVFDVSGAGDTVIASFMLSVLAGASPAEAAAISNHAAGVVVAKVGTATVTREELMDAFEHDEHELS